MDLNLKGKTIIITGGATGIGKAAAKEFLNEGANVCILGRRLNVLEDFAKELSESGMSIYYKDCDVTDTSKVKKYAEHVFQKFHSIDVWINNAGIAIDKPFLDFNDTDWDTINSINLKSVFECTQIAARYMKAQHSGVIINASSFASKIPHANGVLYAATKAAVSNMIRSTASALAPYGIRVVGYIPGMIVTPISTNMIEKYESDLTKNISLGRLGVPEDLAKPIVFLSSDAARYISGCDLEITGGKFATQDCSMPWSKT